MTGKRLRQCLKVLGWSQQFVADEWRVSRELVTKIARGDSKLTPEEEAWLERWMNYWRNDPPPRRKP
jgi:transcriptional regulator with XRE-family HTH domain